MSESADPRREMRRENVDATRQMREGQAYDLPDDRFDMLMPGEPLAPEPASAPKMEPLFNKKVMVAWAAFALALWFAVSFVVPVAVESAKTAITQAVKEAGEQGADGRTKVIVLPNGKRIIIKNDPVTHTTTVTTRELDPAAATPASGAAVAAPAPVAPVVPPAPAPSGSRK